MTAIMVKNLQELLVRQLDSATYNTQQTHRHWSLQTETAQARGQLSKNHLSLSLCFILPVLFSNNHSPHQCLLSFYPSLCTIINSNKVKRQTFSLCCAPKGKFSQIYKKKSRIWETKNLSTDADSSNNQMSQSVCIPRR